VNILSRREFLVASAAGTCGILRPAHSSAASKLDISFFLVGDTHYLGNREDPDQLDEISKATNARLIDHLNQLPGTEIPENAGGTTLPTPKGLIHAGDLIDSGDKNGAVFTRMQDTEWKHFVGDYGLSGKDGRLKFPVYEIHGNHDSPQGDGTVVKNITARNKNRVGLSNVSKNGLHYSWDWGPVHFVNLGIVVGAVKEVKRKRRYNPLDSLEFLLSDLKQNVGESGRPVILTHHVDVARYSTAPNPDGPATSAEWDPADVRSYFDALKAYNVIAILYGHTHARNVYRWDGTPKKAEQGFYVFNVDNSAHFASKQQACFHFQILDDEMIVREFASPDRWETAGWSPQVWKSPIALKKV